MSPPLPARRQMGRGAGPPGCQTGPENGSRSGWVLPACNRHDLYSPDRRYRDRLSDCARDRRSYRFLGECGRNHDVRHLVGGVDLGVVSILRPELRS